MVNKWQIIFFVLLLTSCDVLINDNKKGFYEYYKNYDIIRIPLIEPYEIYSSDDGANWFFDVPFGKILEGLQISDVKSLYVDNDLIFIYSSMISLPGEMTSAWFVFETKGKTSNYYTDYEQFVKDYPASKNMKPIRIIFNEFKSNQTLPWRAKKTISTK